MFHNIARDRLSEAFALLGLTENRLRNSEGELTRIVSQPEHLNALFSYFYIAGYLDDSLLQKAVTYLSTSKPFQRDEGQLITDLKSARDSAMINEKFDAGRFIKKLSEIDYLMVDDYIDLITFLQQTAFDRQFGVERDRLQAKPWMELYSSEFKEILINLGVATPLPPAKKQYLALCVMGASMPRVKQRLDYFKTLSLTSSLVLALSGMRELSKGLDVDQEVMEAVARDAGLPVLYVEKTIGADTRLYLNGVTETMMVNYLIQRTCADRGIETIDSVVQAGHWRATTSQNAADVAKLILQKIKLENVAFDDANYDILIIAEQPYATRMSIQIQREFNRIIAAEGLEEKLSINIEGSGPGVADNQFATAADLSRINSELGALMAERYYNARASLEKSNANVVLRESEMIMFSTRDKKYQQNQAADLCRLAAK